MLMRLCLGLCILFSASSAEAGVIVAEAFNDTFTPSALTWESSTATQVGWKYTASNSFDLVGLATKFSLTDGRSVGVQLFAGYGGALLGSSSFIPSTNALAPYAQFVTPVAIVAGTEYFVGFTNVGDLGLNVTDNVSGTLLSDGLYYGVGNYSVNLPLGGAGTDFYAAPILQFLKSDGFASVPEPSSFALFGAIGAFGVWKRRRSQKVA